MKKIALAVMLTSALALAAEAVAQQPSTRDAAKPSREVWRLETGQVATKDLIGTRVKNAQGKDIGEIDQLVLDPKDGKISHVVVGVGGLMGIGEEKRVIQWSDLKLSASTDRDRVVATVDQAALERAPRYEARRAAGERTPPAASPATAPAPEKKDTKKDEPKKP